jgi:hypothetical protein
MQIEIEIIITNVNQIILINTYELKNYSNSIFIHVHDFHNYLL